MSYTWHFLCYSQMRILNNEFLACGSIFDEQVWSRFATVLNIWPTTIDESLIPVLAKTFYEMQYVILSIELYGLAQVPSLAGE